MSAKVELETGGDRIAVNKSGILIVRAGGILRAEPGAILDIPEAIEFYAGTSFTISERERWIRTTSSSAVSIIVPPYSAVPFPPGTVRQVMQGGTGQVTFVAGAGVTINTPETLKIAKQFAVAMVMATDVQDVWDLCGYLEAAMMLRVGGLNRIDERGSEPPGAHVHKIFCTVWRFQPKSQKDRKNSREKAIN